MNAAGSRWLVRPSPRPAARLRLYCLPYAGGGASIYFRWRQLLPDQIEVVPVQLPGREQRYREPFAESIAAITAELEQAILSEADRPFAIFGHSLGASLGLDLVRSLERRGGPRPGVFFASGRRPPHLPENEAPLHELPDDDFLRLLQERYNSLPAALLNNAEMRRIYTTTLRADFRLLETHDYRHGQVLATPVVALGGADDAPHVAEIAQWREYTAADFVSHILPGGHFFLQSAQDEVLKLIA
ncbi:MAG TPA: alpha/beta fold hydrolase, partial [Pirellulales bacterium]